MLRRQLAGFLAACLLLPLAACGGGEPVETDWTVRQMAQAVWDSQSPAEAVPVLPGSEMYEVFLTDNYALEPSLIADGAVLASSGAAAQEVAVLYLADEAEAETVQTALESYLIARAAIFAGYLPDEAAVLEQSEVAVRGRYVALLACRDVEAARDAFARCFTDPPPEEDGAAALPADEAPPEEAADAPAPQVPADGEAADAADAPAEVAGSENAQPPAAPEPSGGEAESADGEAEPAEDPPEAAEAPADVPAEEPPASDSDLLTVSGPWTYDEARLLDAWAAGDWSDLADQDREILDVCAAVIAAVAPDTLSDYEKELAIHDWMIEHGHYDSDSLSQLPGVEGNSNNENPYGFLIDGLGICRGYASTFQLFMRLLGIECLTVHGTAYSYTTEHAWNQVLLDGAWYCVDLTWDDPTTSYPVSEETAHRYFNVTSEFLRSTDHQWDETAVPEAVGSVHTWQPG